MAKVKALKSVKQEKQTLKTGMRIEYMGNMAYLAVPVKIDSIIEDAFIILSSIVAITPDEYGVAKDCMIQTKEASVSVGKKPSEIFHFLQDWYATNAMENAIGADDFGDR